MPKILIFEDDPFLRGMYETKYRMEGFEVASYESPTEEPVKIVVKEKPDLISMDVLMPIKNGFEATTLIKADPRTKNIPLVFLTNLGQPVDIEKGKALGANDYLIKANHQPKDVVNITRKILGLPIPKEQKSASKKTPNETHPRNKNFEHEQVEVPAAKPSEEPVKNSITISRTAFYWLATLATIGAISVVFWLLV